MTAFLFGSLSLWWGRSPVRVDVLNESVAHP
jgi:hypothetical protein